MKSLLNDGSRQYLETVDLTATWSVTQHLRLLMFAQFAKHNGAKKILDVGFGENFLIEYLEKLGYEGKYLGIDLNQEYVDDAQQKKTKVDATYKFAGLNEVDETFDVIVLGELVEHLEKNEVTAFLKDCKSKLNEGGTILISTPNKIDGKINWPDDHIDEFTYEELQNVVEEAGLREVRTFGLWNNTENTIEMLAPNEAIQYALFAHVVPKSILNVMSNLTKPAQSRAILMIAQ